MSMYSNRDIADSVKKKQIRIEPFDRKNLQSDAYKLHLDGDIAVPKSGLLDQKLVTDYSSFYSKKKSENFVLRPGAFILAKTKEKITIPRGLSGIVGGRSTIALMGISVIKTAPLIHAGHGLPNPRKIILEILNSSPFDIVLHEGMNIGEISFLELKTPTDIPYDSYGNYGKKNKKDELFPLKE